MIVCHIEASRTILHFPLIHMHRLLLLPPWWIASPFTSSTRICHSVFIIPGSLGVLIHAIIVVSLTQLFSKVCLPEGQAYSNPYLWPSETPPCQVSAWHSLNVCWIYGLELFGQAILNALTVPALGTHQHNVEAGGGSVAPFPWIKQRIFNK